jgi:hypothetical protein
MTNSGAEITVEASTLQAFQSSVRGMMIRPALQSMLNDTYPAGLYNYYKSHYISGISAELIDIMVDSFVKVPSPMSALGFEQFGGAMRRVGVEDTAFRHRDVAYDPTNFFHLNQNIKPPA